MVEPGVTNLVYHTITARLRTARSGEALQALQADLEALGGTQGLVSAWRPSECNGAAAFASLAPKRSQIAGAC